MKKHKALFFRSMSDILIQREVESDGKITAAEAEADVKNSRFILLIL